MKILYICNPNSIHDMKWMSFFSKKEDFTVYAIGEGIVSENVLTEMALHNIKLLPPLNTLSIKTPFTNFRSIQKLRKHCSKYQIDIVHVLFATPYALWVSYIKTPYIITTRGSDVLVVLPELKLKRGLKGIYFRLLFKKFKTIFEHANVITCTSELQKDRIIKLFNVQAQVVRTGVDVNKIHSINTENHLPKQLEGKQYIFSPRFMSPIYNIEFQIKAIQLLSNSIHESYTFVFVRGKQYDEIYYNKQLKTLIENKKINYIVFDFLDQKSMWATYKRASLTIMTPISDGTPNSALEAMAACCPLIVSDLPYDKELFENTCEKIQTNNHPKILAQKIEQSLLNLNRFTQIALKAVSIHGNRSIEMKKMETLYKTQFEIYNLNQQKV